PVGAVRPLTPPAPPFPPDAAWVNSVPLPMDLLRGRRVTLIAFLNLNNLRSRRAAAVLGRWWDRYALDGLMVVGVHTPDYEFDRDPLRVRRGVKREGAKYPFVIDTRRKIWEGYQNEGWPAFYLVDPKGRVVHDKLGEGSYLVFEREIQAALEAFNGHEPPLGQKVESDPKRDACSFNTPSFYIGSRRGVSVKPASPKEQRPVSERRDGEATTLGRWEEDAEALRYAGTGAGLKDQFYLIWRGSEAGAVLSGGGSGSPVKVFLKMDNLWLHGGNAGPDVRWDDEDRSYVLVDEGRLYMLAKDDTRERMHEMTLHPSAAGAAVHAFEFSDFCEAPPELR
ncbi:MAG: thioredoxin, partial [Elusimicrobia bacterium]